MEDKLKLQALQQLLSSARSTPWEPTTGVNALGQQMQTTALRSG